MRPPGRNRKWSALFPITFLNSKLRPILEYNEIGPSSDGIWLSQEYYGCYDKEPVQ